MNIRFHSRGLNVNPVLRHRLEQTLEGLQGHILVNTAAVVLERERDRAPAFRALVLLEVPGPVIHAEARDHTLEAAWLKVSSALRKQIEQRKSGSQGRSKASHQGRDGPRVNQRLPRIRNRIFGSVGLVAQ